MVGRPLTGRAITAAAWSADQHRAAGLDEMLRLRIDALAVDIELARGARLAAGDPRRCSLGARAFRQERDGDRLLSAQLEHDLLPGAAAIFAASAATGAQLPELDAERRKLFDHFDRRRRDVARPREHVNAVPVVRGSESAVHEEQ